MHYHEINYSTMDVGDRGDWSLPDRKFSASNRWVWPRQWIAMFEDWGWMEASPYVCEGFVEKKQMCCVGENRRVRDAFLPQRWGMGPEFVVSAGESNQNPQIGVCIRCVSDVVTEWFVSSMFRCVRCVIEWIVFDWREWCAWGFWRVRCLVCVREWDVCVSLVDVRWVGAALWCVRFVRGWGFFWSATWHFKSGWGFMNMSNRKKGVGLVDRS